MVDAKHTADESPVVNETPASLTSAEALVKAALPIVRAYATANPQWPFPRTDGVPQDPMGAHAWLEAYTRAALATSTDTTGEQ